MSCGNDVEDMGGELDEARLRRITTRALLLRNRLVLGDEDPLTLDDDGETPTLVGRPGDDGETSRGSCEVHMGCGDTCGVFAEVPFDGDMGGVPTENAEAIVHAGRDQLDLVHEVIKLRKLLARSGNLGVILSSADDGMPAAFREPTIAEVAAFVVREDPGPRPWRDGDERCHCTHCDECGRLYRTTDIKNHREKCPTRAALHSMRQTLHTLHGEPR